MRFTLRFFSQTSFSVLMLSSVCPNPSTHCFSTSQCIQEIARPQHALAPCFWSSVRVMRTMQMSQCFSHSRRTICSFGSGFVCVCLFSLGRLRFHEGNRLPTVLFHSFANKRVRRFGWIHSSRFACSMAD